MENNKSKILKRKERLFIMRIQFVLGTNVENTIDIEVTEVPTEQQVKAIEDDIYNRMDKWEEENGDFAEFDYYGFHFWICSL